MTDAIVEARNIRKTYPGGVEALRDVSIAFPQGQLSTLLGPSGCGKTTLLKMIAGLLEPSAGQVFVKGKAVTGPGPERAFVFQDFALMPWATVLRNVNPSLVAMCKSFQGTRWQQVAKIVIPDASPLIFAGLRLGISAGFIGIVLAELLITPTGIGDLITYHRSVANYAEMYATVVSIIVFSAVTVGGLQRVELTLFRPEKREIA